VSGKKKAPKVPTPSAPVPGQPPSNARANALRSLQGLLGTQPAAFSAEEWAVVHAVLDPDKTLHYSESRKAWTKYALLSRARACFPGLPSHEALRAFRDTLQIPHVATLISDFRHLELLDVLEHRQMLRLASHSVLALERFMHDDQEVRDDRKGTAALTKEVLGAAKFLMDLDDLQVRKEPQDSALPGLQAPEDLTSAVDKVMEDLASRKEPET